MQKLVGALAMLCVCADTALAQEVIAQEPPVYTEGEEHASVLTLEDGTTGVYLQKVQMHPLRNVLMMRSTLVLGGVESALEVNEILETGAENGHDAGVPFHTIRTTCKRNSFYPITLGRTVACTTKFVVGGRPLTRNLERTYRVVKYDIKTDKRMVCGTEVMQTEEFKQNAEFCVTEDGKWLETYTIKTIQYFDKS